MATRISTQLLDSISEESVFPTITEQFEEKPMLYNWIFKGEGEEISSRGCRIPIYLTPSASNGWGQEGGDLPIPAADEDQAMRVRYARYRRSIEITWDALNEMEKKNILLKGVMARVARHINSASKEINRFLYGFGDGTVAVPIAVNGNTVTFARTTLEGYTHGSRKILKNGRFDFIIEATGQKVAGSTDVSICGGINRGTAQATFSFVPAGLAAAIAAGRVRLVYQNSWNRAIRGFLYHFSNGNEVYQTSSRFDNPDLRVTVVPANGSDITVALFLLLEQEMKFRVEEKAGEKVYICNPSQRYQYELLGHSAKRFDGKANVYDGGFRRVEYNGDTLMEDVDCDYDKIYCVYQQAFRKFESRPLGPMKEGSGFWKDVPSFSPGSEDTGTHKERVRGYIGMDSELGCIRPGLLGVINNLGFKEMGTSY